MTSGIGERMRAFRVRDQVTQAQVAEVLGVTAPQVSRAEAGTRPVSGFELRLLAEAFGWDVRDLLGMDRARAKLSVAARLRSADGSATAGRERAADLVEVDSILDDLGVQGRSEGMAIQELLGPPRNESEATAQGAEFAGIIRDKFGIVGPVSDLVGVAEDELGIDVVIAPIGDSCDGVIAVGERLAFAVVNSDVMSGRQRFTLAHEIGHGVMGDVVDVVLVDDNVDPLIETRAHAFASAFLMPEGDLRTVMSEKIDAVRLADAMIHFGVSWTALMRRCSDLRIEITDPLRSLSGPEVFAAAGRDGDVERLEAPMAPRAPARIVRRVRDAYADALVGPRVVGTALGLDGEDLDAALESVPVRFEVPEPVEL